MEFNRFELDVLISGVREQRKSVEKNFIERTKKQMSSYKIEEDEASRIADDLLVLNKYNNLLDKLEDEWEKQEGRRRR